MTCFFNDTVNWPAIFTQWLPDVRLVAATPQNCPGCKTSNSFQLQGDWMRSGAGLCRTCNYGEGLDWLKLAYQINTDTALQIVRGEIASATKLLPIHQPTHKPIDNSMESVINLRLKKAKPINLSEDNAITRLVKRYGIASTTVFEDLYFANALTLHPPGKKPVKSKAILLVLRNSNNQRVGVETVFISDDVQWREVADNNIKNYARKYEYGSAVRLSALQPKVLVTVGIKCGLALYGRFPDKAVMFATSADHLKALQLPNFVRNAIVVVKPHNAIADAAYEFIKIHEHAGRYAHVAHDFNTVERAVNHAWFAEAC